jgi:hypothetical protein
MESPYKNSLIIRFGEQAEENQTFAIRGEALRRYVVNKVAAVDAGSGKVLGCWY